MVTAVILAGGKGVRFGDATPKQLKVLAGKAIMQYVVEAFAYHNQVDDIIVVHPALYEKEVRAICAPFEKNKSIRYVAGGSSRPASTLAALELIGDENQKVIFHDAVRPFLAHDIISRTIHALDQSDGVDVVIDATDTIVRVDAEGGTLADIPNRAFLRRGQTPQGFWSESLKAAYANFDEEALSKFSDDCGVLLAHNPAIRIATVAGDERNIKITTPMDLFIAEQILYSGYAQTTEPAVHSTESQVVVILGASSGLGLASVEALTGENWKVYSGSRSDGVDIRDRLAVDRFLANVEKEAGRIDAIVNYAGVLEVGDFATMPQVQIDELIDVNFTGSLNVARVGFPYLARSKGALVLVASSSYYRGRKGTAVYSATKAAVVNLTQALAEEWVENDIAVSCVVPRRADTPMRRKAFPDEDPRTCVSAATVAAGLVTMLVQRQSGMIKHIY